MPSSGAFEILSVPASATYPGRQAWLRPHQHLDEVWFDADEAEGALHLVAFRGGRLAGVASALPERPVEAESTFRLVNAWRLRGMATAPEVRRQGLGSLLLARSSEHVLSVGGTALWCHARLSAVAFYAALDFVSIGDPFEVPSIGPHVFMWRSLSS